VQRPFTYKDNKKIVSLRKNKKNFRKIPDDTKKAQGKSSFSALLN